MSGTTTVMVFLALLARSRAPVRRRARNGAQEQGEAVQYAPAAASRARRHDVFLHDDRVGRTPGAGERLACIEDLVCMARGLPSERRVTAPDCSRDDGSPVAGDETVREVAVQQGAVQSSARSSFAGAVK
jgi:hypothetical protein